jgi:hypothetical protein
MIKLEREGKEKEEEREVEERKCRERRKRRKGRKGGWKGKEKRKGAWNNRRPTQALEWNDGGKLRASACMGCISADIHYQNPTVHMIRLLTLHRDWLIGQCNMEQ